MVFIAFVHVAVCPETFVIGIVVMICPCARPIVALYSKMIIAVTGQFTHARAAFKQSLGQRYTGRNVIFKHFRNGQILILINVSLIA